eukprot:TRINITY_DN13577_c1_g2_i1.p1 TRINITY_DN13577_c1_g2~~TRINITY_DN13577_c1_g2_i1.p1  ORF type:complete len:196 (+),score=45.65 TRINITY_DN13577_c1_g2_i1:52-588(+)
MHEAEVKGYSDVLAALLEGVTGESRSKLTVYDACEEVTLPIERYIQTWVVRSGMGPNLILYATFLLDAYLLRNQEMKVTRFNRHRLIASALLIAAKTMKDRPAKNTFYAQITGVTLAELNRLERTFLVDVDFQTYFSVEKCRAYRKGFENEFVAAGGAYAKRCGKEKKASAAGAFIET